MESVGICGSDGMGLPGKAEGGPPAWSWDTKWLEESSSGRMTPRTGRSDNGSPYSTSFPTRPFR